MKWMTVQEYADYEGISLAAAYKRIKEDRANHEKRFGKLVVRPKNKKLKAA
jgi:hypothetical protein